MFDPSEDRVRCSNCHRMVEDDHDFDYCADPLGGDSYDD